MDNETKNKISKLIISLFLIFLFFVPILVPFQVNFGRLFFLENKSIKSTFDAYAVTSGPDLFCQNNMAVCANGNTPTCLDPQFQPKCLPGFVPFIECCKQFPFSTQCDPNMPISCTSGGSTTSSTTSSSGSSSLCSSGIFCTSGFVPDCDRNTETFLCLNGNPVCHNNTTHSHRFPACILPACSSGVFCPQGRIPDCTPSEPFTCIGGIGDIPCCFNSTTSQCRIPNCIVPACTSGSFCTSGQVPDCSSGEVFVCFGGIGGLNNHPCCFNQTTGQCRIPQCVSPSSSSSSGGSSTTSSSSSSGGSSTTSSSSSSSGSTSSTTGGSRLNLDITAYIESTPELPKIAGVTYEDGIGYAYVGSNPSFEISLLQGSGNIVSVNLQDSKGAKYSNIPFITTEIHGSETSFILTLYLPERTSEGHAKLVLSLSDGSSQFGIINLIKSFDARALRERKPVALGEPQISRVNLFVRNRIGTLKVFGKYFVGRGFVYGDGNTTKVYVSPKQESNTYVTVLPSTLGINLKSRTVSKDGTILKSRFKASNSLRKGLKAVLVVATPKGIVSKQFVVE